MRSPNEPTATVVVVPSSEAEPTPPSAAPIEAVIGTAVTAALAADQAERAEEIAEETAEAVEQVEGTLEWLSTQFFSLRERVEVLESRTPTLATVEAVAEVVATEAVETALSTPELSTEVVEPEAMVEETESPAESTPAEVVEVVRTRPTIRVR